MEIFDIDVEDNLVQIYWEWAIDNVDDATEPGDSERASFFAGLFEEVCKDLVEAEDEYRYLGIEQKRDKDGKIKNCIEYWSDEEPSSSTSSSEEDDSAEDQDEGDSDSDSQVSLDNPRISTAATDAEELSWLSSIDPEAYPPLQNNDEADNEDSHDFDVFEDALSTLSEHDDEETREAKRRRLD